MIIRFLKKRKVILSIFFIFLILLLVSLLYLKNELGLIIQISITLLALIYGLYLFKSVRYEQKIIINRYKSFIENNNNDEAIIYLTSLDKSNYFSFNIILIDLYLLSLYFTKNQYEEAKKILDNQKWNYTKYSLLGYYASLLNLYNDNLEQAKYFYDNFIRFSHKDLYKHKNILIELFKFINKEEHDKSVIDSSSLDIVKEIYNKYL